VARLSNFNPNIDGTVQRLRTSWLGTGRNGGVARLSSNFKLNNIDDTGCSYFRTLATSSSVLARRTELKGCASGTAVLQPSTLKKETVEHVRLTEESPKLWELGRQGLKDKHERDGLLLLLAARAMRKIPDLMPGGMIGMGIIVG